MKNFFFILFGFLFSLFARGEVTMHPTQCGAMQIWNPFMGMCDPLPMKDMNMRMLMLHGNFFLTGATEEGPRGRSAIYSTNMYMADIGTSLGDSQYLNLDYMGTFEKWTVPSQGYPELLQIGETQSNGVPFLDAQHPHSSPVMGLTFSDTIRLSQETKDYVRLFFAPRGESTDGPIAFMHRPTGMVNPQAPLGHHIGQDVGHITSTVLGGALKIDRWQLELSTFHGAEPSPTHVDLPIGSPDSFAARLTYSLSDHWLAMTSAAYISHPEPDEPLVASENRYSTSIYYQGEIARGLRFYNALIYGMVTHYDEASNLSSFLEEFYFRSRWIRPWGRIEVLQRTPAELAIPSAFPNNGLWVTAVTLGDTFPIQEWNGLELDLGAAVTKDFLPSSYQSTYGGNPWSGEVFLEMSGMKMWDL